MRRTFPYAVALGTASAIVIAAVQNPAPAPVVHPALSGVWVLSDADPGGGKAPDQVEVVPMGGAPRPGTGATDGAGSGTPGGRGGFVPGSTGSTGSTNGGGGAVHGGFTDWGNKLPSTKPKRLTSAEALRKETFTPPEELSIELSIDSVVIDDGMSGPVKYRINGKTESHQFTNGSVKTKTSWDGPLLRQVIDIGEGSKLARVFELGADDGLLHVTVGETGALPMRFGVVPAGQETKPASTETRKSVYKRKG